jgi:hypothetical protein
MKNNITILVSIFLPIFTIMSLGIVVEPVVQAENVQENPQSSTEESFEKIEFKEIDRAENLRKFFKKYNSPLADNAETFVRVADQYGIDYRILPAITGVESTFAKFYIVETHNPFGWGSGHIAFNSFDEAIEGVAKGLNEIYLSRGRDTVEKIAPVYNPPYPTNWSRNVNYFMDQMTKI